jgi:ABC-type uncharacterized transport system YnjBCD ATPase subunit
MNISDIIQSKKEALEELKLKQQSILDQLQLSQEMSENLKDEHVLLHIKNLIETKQTELKNKKQLQISLISNFERQTFQSECTEESTEERLNQLKIYLQAIQVKKDFVEEQRLQMQNKVQSNEKELEVLLKVNHALKQLMDRQQKVAVDTLISILNAGLQMMFDFEAKVHINTKTTRNITSFEVLTEIKNAEGEIIKGNYEAFGGSLTTIQSLLLRVVTILKFKMRRVLLLDEFFGSLDPKRIEALSQLITSLVEEHQFDILCVTHDEELARMGSICYQITKEKEKSVFFSKIYKKEEDL